MVSIEDGTQKNVCSDVERVIRIVGSDPRPLPPIDPELHKYIAALDLDDALRDDLLCPISRSIFHDPVVASDGHTYERTHLKEWIANKKAQAQPIYSPMTREPMDNKTMIPNMLARSQVAAYLEQLNQDRLSHKKQKM